MKTSQAHIRLLLIATWLETLCCTFFLYADIFTGWVAILYIAAGLLIGTLPLLPVKETGAIPSPDTSVTHFTKQISRLFIFSISVFICITGYRIMQQNAIDYHVADMLPQIKAMCQRLIHGEQVYAPIQEIWNGKQPPYLPLMWMPFTPAEWFGIDVRWITLAFVILGIYLITKILPRTYTGKITIPVGGYAGLFILIAYLMLVDRLTIARTEEGVVIGYYLFLAFALTTKKPVLIGIAIACCLLSRFSLFFWVPVYLVYLFFFDSKKMAITVASVIAAIILVVFFIPYGFRQPAYFMNIPADYHVGVDRAWSANAENGKYYQHSLGYARFFDISQIALLHQLQIWAAAFLPAALLALYAMIRKKIQLQSVFFPICSLKLTLVFFYNMVEVPYYYLFLVSTFFTYAVLFFYLKVYRTTAVDESKIIS